MINKTPVIIMAEMKTLYPPNLSRNIGTARRKVASWKTKVGNDFTKFFLRFFTQKLTGVQNMIAETFPKGTCLTATKMVRSNMPPKIPWRKSMVRFSRGPMNLVT